MFPWSLFILCSLPLIWVSRRSLKNVRAHGFYRFFIFEGIVAMALLNGPHWFDNPMSLRQMLSVVFLCLSAYFVYSGVRELRQSGGRRHGETPPENFTFENTGRLVPGTRAAQNPQVARVHHLQTLDGRMVVFEHRIDLPAPAVHPQHDAGGLPLFLQRRSRQGRELSRQHAHQRAGSVVGPHFIEIPLGGDVDPAVGTDGPAPVVDEIFVLLHVAGIAEIDVAPLRQQTVLLAAVQIAYGQELGRPAPGILVAAQDQGAATIERLPQQPEPARLGVVATGQDGRDRLVRRPGGRQ